MKFFCLLLLASIASAQFFDPVIDDKTYLDQIEEQIKAEVENSAVELIQQAKDTEKVTKSYIAIKLKDNVFKALRTLAQTEAVAFQENLSRSRVGRQESSDSTSGGTAGSSGSGDTETAETEGGSEGGDDESATEKATTPLNGLSTAVKINQNVFQFIGEAIKTIFKGVGGKKSYVRGGIEEEASSSKLTEALPNLMKKPYADQLVGILSLLASENGAQKKENVKKVDQNPFKALFGNRGVGRKSDAVETGVTEYIESLKKNHPLLFPDLYRGISQPQGLLISMSKVIAGIREDIHT